MKKAKSASKRASVECDVKKLKRERKTLFLKCCFVDYRENKKRDEMFSCSCNVRSKIPEGSLEIRQRSEDLLCAQNSTILIQT
ncbi:CLUMA_CG020782, isoform A [Clunio marinus]|uniref:CLUMA_CG020782, isoform A n=1 Tax=Clunio marinus TaxID=568069 RepID=A0A1J1J7T0_9DIPT|nr:CLUMA_CG020782, isoform A [Clunio marinus]